MIAVDGGNEVGYFFHKTVAIREKDIIAITCLNSFMNFYLVEKISTHVPEVDDNGSIIEPEWKFTEVIEMDINEKLDSHFPYIVKHYNMENNNAS